MLQEGPRALSNGFLIKSLLRNKENTPGEPESISNGFLIKSILRNEVNAPGEPESMFSYNSV